MTGVSAAPAGGSASVRFRRLNPFAARTCELPSISALQSFPRYIGIRQGGGCNTSAEPGYACIQEVTLKCCAIIRFRRIFDSCWKKYGQRCASIFSRMRSTACRSAGTSARSSISAPRTSSIRDRSARNMTYMLTATNGCAIPLRRGRTRLRLSGSRSAAPIAHRPTAHPSSTSRQ